MRNREFDVLEQIAGIVLPDAIDFLKPESKFDYRLAMDAQPTLVTVSNAGVPSYLQNYFDPKLIEVLVTPMKAAKIIGETKKGDWTLQTATFVVVENTGEVSSYTDFANSGQANVNTNFPVRQSYLFQTTTMWGQRELEVAGLAKIDLAARKNIASALVLNKFQNKSYFFGISGLQNYGLLNDPSLSAPVAPTTGVGGTTWPVKTPSEIFSDIQKLYVTLVNQTGGIIEADAKLVLAVSPASAGYLMNSNPVFGLTARAQIEMNFPNLRIETAVEYTTGSGELVQLIAEDIEGQEVATCAFNEKMRAHPIVVDTSWFRQKKTCGTFGAIIYQPMGIAAMIGV